MRIVPTAPYLRRVKKLLTDQERLLAETEIASDPEAWPVIAGTGGARIVYFLRTTSGRIYLMAIYAKNEKENLSDAEKSALRQEASRLP